MDKAVKFCNEYLDIDSVKDEMCACNGLQFENNGIISKIGSAVDSNLLIIEQAVEQKVDFLIVHHGLFWNENMPITEVLYKKYKLLLEHNIAVYGAHLPLDGHLEIGNNIAIVNKLQLNILEHEMIDQECQFRLPVCSTDLSINELSTRISDLFPGTRNILFGPQNPQRIVVCSGAIGRLIYSLPRYKIDTLITGEIKQNMFGFAYENKLNIFACGHYATEVFGVQSVGRILAEKFHLPEVFLSEKCEI